MMQRRFSRFVTIAAATVLAAAVPARAQQAGAGSGDAGSRVYAANCVACHQAGGTGVPAAFPPLAGHVPDLLKRADAVMLERCCCLAWRARSTSTATLSPARCRRGRP